MYTSVGTQLDFALAVNLLSQFASCSNKAHLAAFKHDPRYLKGTANLLPNFPRKNHFILYGFTNSSYESSIIDFKPCSKYIFHTVKAGTSWCSQKYKSLTFSIT